MAETTYSTAVAKHHRFVLSRSRTPDRCRKLPSPSPDYKHLRGAAAQRPHLDKDANVCSLTSDGSAYTRFRRALKTGNLNLVVAAAAELPRVGLRDALEVCLLLRDGSPDRYERAATRWVGRFALEAHAVSLEAIESAVAALNALPDAPGEAMERLMALCAEHRLV